MDRQCKDCKHYREDRVAGGWVYYAYVPAKCKRTDYVGDGVATRSCAEERNDPSGCGRIGKNWEAA